MAERRVLEKTSLIMDEVTSAQMEFNKAVFELGISLIDDYRTGRCTNRDKTLEGIIRILEVQPKIIWRD